MKKKNSGRIEVHLSRKESKIKIGRPRKHLKTEVSR